MTELHIRRMIPRDFTAVLAIERASFPYPWTKGNFVRYRRYLNAIGMVVEQEGRIVGYFLYRLSARRLWLDNLAVAPDHRRQGIGRACLAKLRSKLSARRRNQLWTGVGESNLDAQLFLRVCGLRAVRVLRGVYEETDEDAYLFRYYRVRRSPVPAEVPG